MDALGGVEGRGLQKPSTNHHHPPVFKPKESVSQDNLRLRTIFDRLDTLELNPHAVQNLRPLPLPSTTPNTRCSCGNIDQLSTSWGHQYVSYSGPATRTMSRDSDLDSSDESDEEPFSLVSMVALLVAEERKGSARPRKHGMLKNLASSCHGDVVSENNLHQLVRLTASASRQIKQAAFLALRQATTNEVNSEMLLRMSLVPQLLSLLQDKMEASSHALGAAVLEQIVLHKKLAEYWLDKMITQGLPILIGCLSSNQEPETKSAIGLLLSNLACYFEIAVLLLDHCMEDLKEIWLRYPVMKASLTRLFSRIVQHTDHTIAGVLEHRVMELVATTLMKEDNCSVQTSAAEFFLALCGSGYGLSAFLDEGKAKILLQVLRTTHCRRLRELCVATLNSILQRANANQLRDLTLQAEFAFKENSTSMSLSKGRGEPQNLAAGKEDVNRRSRRGIAILINILVETIHKEAKITVDHPKKTHTIAFRPGINFFKTLSDAVRCLCRMAVMPVGRHRHSIEGPKRKSCKLNTDVIQLMFQQGAICVLHLLNTYTHHLFPISGEQDSLQHHRNIDVLHLQAMMKVWQMKKSPGLNNPLPCEEELNCIQQLLEFVGMFAKCSSKLWNRDIENDVKYDIEKYHGVTEDLETAKASSSHYCSVKTVDQAIPSMVKFENNTAKRLQEKHMTSSTEQRKMAWGDKNNLGKLEKEVCHSSSNIPSGDSQRHLRTSSLKKRDLDKFDLSKSIFTEQDRLTTSTKPKDPTRVKKDLRTAGYVRKRPQDNLKPEAKVESAITDETQEIHKKLRMKLFQEGVCETVGPWLGCTVPQIQILAAQCLHCMIQPSHPDEIHQLRQAAEEKERKNRHKSGSEMAKALAERDKILSQVIGQMSTHSASVMKDALGLKGQSERESKKLNKGHKVGTKPPANKKPALHSDEPIGWQCSIHLLEMCGDLVLAGLSSDFVDVRRAILLLLYDLVDFGEIVIHMKLASLGVVSRLMNFVRQNSHKHDIALLALMILRNLTADFRLKQIFKSEGGEAFLNGLIKTSEGALRMHLQRFLEHITEGPAGLL